MNVFQWVSLAGAVGDLLIACSMLALVYLMNDTRRRLDRLEASERKR